MAKRKLYDLDAGYWRNSYFFDLPSLALGLHPENSVARRWSVNLKVFPDRKAGFRLGYRRNQQFGTAFTTESLLLDTFQFSSPRRLASDEFSGGVFFNLRPFSLLIDQSFIRFRDDRQLLPNDLNPVGLNGSRLEDGLRDAPARIATPTTRAVARYDAGGRFDLTARYLYSNGDFKLNRFDNLLYRLGSSGLPLRQIISSTGVSDKPTHFFDVSETVELAPRLVLHHFLHYDTYTLTGFLDVFGVLEPVRSQGAQPPGLPIEGRGGTVTDYQLFRNQFDVELSLHRALSLIGTWRYSDRHVAFGSHLAGPGGSVATPAPLVTTKHSGGGGVAFVPNERARFRAEIEKGTASSSFTRIEPLSTLRTKVQAELKPVTKLSVSGGFVIADNKNEPGGTLGRYDLNDRQVTAQVSYAASDRLVFSGGYNFYQLHSATDIVIATLSRLAPAVSLYQTDTHLVYGEVQAPAGPRLTLRLGYQFLKDTGATFPLRQHMPRAGLALAVSKNVAVEGHWQHWSYNERDFLWQDYRANMINAFLRFRF
jgi:hypothetical protein